jgi:hypothetical protein
MVKIIKLHTVKGEARIDSRIIAKELGNQPETVIRLVDEYQRDFEEFGVVRFQTQKLRTSDFSDLKSGKSQGKAKRGRPERYALLLSTGQKINPLIAKGVNFIALAPDG